MIHKELALEIKGGEIDGRKIPIAGAVLRIGREPSCEIHLDDSKVSRVHGIVEMESGVAYYRDNGSTNGTYLNGAKVTAERLRAGDVLEIGPFQIGVVRHGRGSRVELMASDAEVQAKMGAEGVSPDKLFDDLVAAQSQTLMGIPADLEPERVIQGLRGLFKLVDRFSRNSTMEAMMEDLADGMMAVVEAERLVILLRDEDGGTLIPRLSRDNKGRQELHFGISRTILAMVEESRSTILANDVLKDPRLQTSESIPNLELKSVLCAPLIAGGKVIGAMYLDNRVEAARYTRFDVSLATAVANQGALAINNMRLAMNLQNSYEESLRLLVKLIEVKDEYTRGHTERVKQYAIGLARQLAYEGTHLERLGLAAELHDIGKIFIADSIINKADGLTALEYENMKEHVLKGVAVLGDSPSMRDIVPWIRGHHERWDGSGYPDGLKGEETPPEARILAMADAFDAMTSKRTYNQPTSFMEALDRIEQAAGKHFDPDMVKAFSHYIRQSTTQHGHEEISDRPASPAVEDSECSTEPPTPLPQV